MGRRARVSTVAVAVLVLAVSAVYVGVTQTYALEQGSMFSYGADAAYDRASATATHPLEPGKRVEVAISVRNPGSLPITLDGVSLETSPDLRIDDITVIAHSTSNPNCCLPEKAEPFHAIDVAAHDEAMVWLVLRIIGAVPYAPCGGPTVHSVVVSYRVLGMHRDQRIALPTVLYFQAACD